MSTDVALVTARQMPKADLDTPLLVTALADLGVTSQVVAWDEPGDWSAFGLVVIRTPWDYVERLDDFLAWAEGVAAVTEVANPFEVLAWNSHKRYLFDLEAAGVAIVSTRQVAQYAPFQFQRVVLAQFDGEVVIKPAVSAGAWGTLRAAADSVEAAAHLEALALLGDVLVQPLVESVLTEGEVSLAYYGGSFSHATRKAPAAGDYRVQDQHGGTLHDHEADGDELAVAGAALDAAFTQVAVPLLYARVDLVATAEGPAVMELELIDPELFVRRDPAAPSRFARAIATRLGRDAVN